MPQFGSAAVSAYHSPYPLSFLRHFVGLISQGLSITHSDPSTLTERKRAMVQSLTLTHTTNRLQGTLRAIAQSLGITDSTNRLRLKVKAITPQTLSIASAILQDMQMVKTFAQSLSINANTANRFTSRIKAVSENVILNHLIVRLKGNLNVMSFFVRRMRLRSNRQG